VLIDALPLRDRNDLFVRRVSRDEARRLVDNGNAEPIVHGEWRERQDAEWLGIRLTLSRDYNWSRCSLTAHDAKRVAGEYGDKLDPDFIAKMLLWKFVGDSKAPRVGIR